MTNIRKTWGGGERGRSFKNCWMDMLAGAPIHHSTYRVLMVMAQRFQTHEGHEYGFTVEQLAEVTGMSKATVKRAWSQARKAGWIVCVTQGRTFRSGEKTFSRYRLAIPADAEWPSYFALPKVEEGSLAGVTGKPHRSYGGLNGDSGGITHAPCNPAEGLTDDPLDGQVPYEQVPDGQGDGREREGEQITDHEWETFVSQVESGDFANADALPSEPAAGALPPGWVERDAPVLTEKQLEAKRRSIERNLRDEKYPDWA